MQSVAATKLNNAAALYERAKEVLPGGCSRNTVLRKPHPLYAAYGKGCRVTDIDGVERIDFANNIASLIHGHAYPAISEAVAKQMEKGTAFTLATESEILFAEHMCSRNSGFEKIRFVNSGTEAVMSALKAARAYTGRPKIAKVEGAYHGLYDYAEISQTASPSNWGTVDSPSSVPVAYGTPQSALDEVVVVPFNDVERTIAILDNHRDQLACVLLDLMPHRAGLMRASDAYVKAIYEWTRRNGALFVCDEVITFRSNYGGAQEWFDVRPDLTAMGKMIGGGFPVGALAGSSDVMNVLNPLADKVLFPHSGTFSANPVTMIAGRIAMEHFDRSAVEKLNTLGEYARHQITNAIKTADYPACVTGQGSMFRVHLKEYAPSNYRETYVSPEEKQDTKFVVDYLFDHGFMMIDTLSGTLSTLMTVHEIDLLAQAIEDAFIVLKEAKV